MASASPNLGPGSAAPQNPVPPSGPHTPNEASCPGEDGADPASMELGMEVRARVGGEHKEGALTARPSRGSTWVLRVGRLEPFASLRPPPRGRGAPHSCCSLPRLPCLREGLPDLRSQSTCSTKGPSRVTRLVSGLSTLGGGCGWGVRGQRQWPKTVPCQGRGPCPGFNFPTCKMGVMSGFLG